MKLLLLVLLLLVAIPAFTQQDSVKITTPGDTVVVTETWTVRQLKQFARQQRRDSIRAHKKVWLSILGGPSYNPEASLGVGGAMLMTVKYGYRTEPANFYGVGYDEIKKAEELKDRYDKDSVTFHKASVQFFPRFVWEVKPNIYVGTLLDFNYNYTKSLADWMKTNPAILKYGNRYHNIGIGALFQYDTRDDVATPFEGVFLSAMGTLYGKYLGGNYNYEMLELEYRQFRQVFKRRSTLAWTAKTQIGMDNVPYSELPNFGNPFDLRGYAWGKYRDKSMAYGIIEYRHMFMSQEAYARGAFWSKFGGVAWIGTGTIGKTPADWDKWKLNYGIGLRIQLQPRKNFRLDIGKEPGQKWGIYMNMTEAF